MTVTNGLDRILQDPDLQKELSGKKLGLLVNPTSVTKDLDHAIDALVAKGIHVRRLFGPEHGVRGEAQDMEAVDESVDPISGIECVSLYGHTFDSLAPPAGTLEDIDLLLADIQDIGARYYTYIYTIGFTMHAAGLLDIPVWVLDRPNPLNGIQVQGNTVLDDYRSFVGMQPMATRHGMTVGEAAKFFDKFCGWSCELRVIEMTGWKRSMWFDETGLPWVMPSPNMPTLDTAIVYPGQCLLEGTNCSEARGTTRPFELFGAPFIDANDLLQKMRGYEIEGISFRAASFRPKFQKHADVTCSGLQTHVTNRNTFNSLQMTFALLSELYKYDGFRWREKAYEFVQDRLAIDLLLGDPVLRKGLEDGDDPIALASAWGNGRTTFDDQRDQCLIYRD